MTMTKLVTKQLLYYSDIIVSLCKRT